MFPEEAVKQILEKVRMAGLKNNRRPIITDMNQRSVQQGTEEIKALFNEFSAVNEEGSGGGVVSTSRTTKKKSK